MTLRRIVLPALLALGLLGTAGFGAATLLAYPPPNCDEVYYASPYVTLRATGNPGLPLFPANEPGGEDVSLVQRGRLYLLGLSATLSVLGVSLWAARLFSFLGWLAAGGLTYLIGARFYSRRVGLLAAAAFVTSIKAFLTSHLARPEGWLGAMVLLAVFAVWRAVERKRTVAAAVLAGIASVAPVDIHPQGIVFVLGLGLAFVWAAGARRRRWDLIGGYVAGGVIGGLAFVAAHAWPSPQLAWQQLVQFAPHYTSLGDSEPGPNALDNLQSLAPFFQLIYWTAGGPLGLLEAGLGAAGVISASLRRTVGDEILVITGVVSMMVFGLVFSQRLVQYGVLWSPFLFLLGAAALERTAEWIATRFRLAAARNSVSPMKWVSDAAVLLGLAGAGIAGLNLAGDVWLVRQYQGGNFAEMNAALARLAPAGASVMGDPNWWWELHKGREYIADDYLVWPGLVSEPDSGAHVPGVMARLRPDYILLDTALGCRIDADPAWAALHEYATEHCELAGQVDGPWLGDEGKRTSLLAQTTSVYQCRL